MFEVLETRVQIGIARSIQLNRFIRKTLEAAVGEQFAAMGLVGVRFAIREAAD